MKTEIIEFIKPNTKKIIIAIILILLSLLITFHSTSPQTGYKGQYSRPITGIPLTYFSTTPTQINAPVMNEPETGYFFKGCNFNYCHFLLYNTSQNLIMYYWSTIVNIIFWYIISALILLIYNKLRK